MKINRYISLIALIIVVYDANMVTRCGGCYVDISKHDNNDNEMVAQESMLQDNNDTRPQAAIENSKAFSPVSKSSDPRRFKEVKADLDSAVDEATFWGRQISEHQLFLQLGLEEPVFKEKAEKLHKEWEKQREKLKNNQDIETLNNWLPLLEKTRKFQIKVLEILHSGKWIGWIFPLFVTHITLELDYLVDKLNALPYSVDDEILFWNRINSEHAAFASHLLDPSERELVLKADEMSTKFEREIPQSEKDMWLKISLKAAEDLDAFNKEARTGAKANKVLSVIHPVLLDHVIREGERGIQTLDKLKTKSLKPAQIEDVQKTQEKIESQNTEITNI